MKKTTAILLIVFMTLGMSLPGYAKWVDNKSLGMSYSLSDSWLQTDSDATTTYYRHSANSNESFFVSRTACYWAISVDSFSLSDIRSVRDEICSVRALSSRLTDANNVYVTVEKVSDGESYVVYNNVKYYKYDIVYNAKAYGYKTTTFYDTFFVTAKYGNVFTVSYTRDASSNHFSDVVNMLSSAIYDNSEIKIYVGNSKIQPDSPAVIYEGRTIVPIRAVAEKMGYSISWDEKNKQVTMLSGDSRIKLVFTVGSGIAQKITSKGTTNIRLDVPASIIGGRTYLPLRAVSEAMDASVEWNANYKTVVISPKIGGDGVSI